MLLSFRYCRPPRPSSTSTTPAPPSQAELLNFADIPRPFKSLNPTTTSKARSNLPANRRNKTLKQILTTEREQAMGLVTEGKRKGKRPLSPKSALEAAKREEERKAAISEAGVHGAAAKTFRKRIQKEQRERARAAKQNKRKGGGDEATPEVEIDDAEEDEAEGSGLLGEERSSETPMREETPTEQEKEEERLLQRKRRLPTYSTVEAPPSLRPRKKYCDVTGLIAPYTDPKTGLRYHNVEIYELMKTFGPGVDQAYLTLRGDGTQIK